MTKPGPADDLSCGGIRRTLASTRHLAALGEREAMREWVAQSGRSIEDFTREERQRRAAAATFPASAASGR